MQDCPKCRLLNPDTALRCDCGYDFPSGTMQESYLPEKEKLKGSIGIGGSLLIAFWGFNVLRSFVNGVLSGLISLGLFVLVLAYIWPRYFSRTAR